MAISVDEHSEWEYLIDELGNEFKAFGKNLERLSLPIAGDMLPEANDVDTLVNQYIVLEDKYERCIRFLNNNYTNGAGESLASQSRSLEQLQKTYSQLVSRKSYELNVLTKACKFLQLRSANTEYIKLLRQVILEANTKANAWKVASLKDDGTGNVLIEDARFYADFVEAVESPGLINLDHDLRERLYDQSPKEYRILLRGLFEAGAYSFEAPEESLGMGPKEEGEKGLFEIEPEVLPTDELLAVRPVEEPGQEPPIVEIETIPAENLTADGSREVATETGSEVWDLPGGRSLFYDTYRWTLSTDDKGCNKTGATDVLNDIKGANGLVPVICHILMVLSKVGIMVQGEILPFFKYEVESDKIQSALEYLIRKRICAVSQLYDEQNQYTVYGLATNSASLLNKMTVSQFIKSIVKSSISFKEEDTLALMEKQYLMKLVEDILLTNKLFVRVLVFDKNAIMGKARSGGLLMTFIESSAYIPTEINALYVLPLLSTDIAGPQPEKVIIDLEDFFSNMPEGHGILLIPGSGDSIRAWQQAIREREKLRQWLGRIFILQQDAFEEGPGIPILYNGHSEWEKADMLPTSAEPSSGRETAAEGEESVSMSSGRPSGESDGESASKLPCEPPMAESPLNVEIQRLLQADKRPLPADLCRSVVWGLLARGRMAVASTLVRAFCGAGVPLTDLAAQIDTALDSPVAGVEYCGNEMYSRFNAVLSGEVSSGDGKAEARLMLSSVLRALFQPGRLHDFDLKGIAEYLRNNGCGGLFDGMPSIKQIINSLFEFVYDKGYPAGFNPQALADLHSGDDVRHRLQRVRFTAQQLLTSPKTSINSLEYRRLLGHLFGQNGLFEKYLKAVAANDMPLLPEVRAFLGQYADCTDGRWRFDMAKIEEDLSKRFVNQFTGPHASAGLGIRYRAKNQAMQNIMKRLGVIMEWLEIHDDAGKRTGREYRILLQEKGTLMELINTAEAELAMAAERAQGNIDRGSIAVLRRTFEDMAMAFENRELDRQRKWYYHEFLKTYHVSLDDNLHPMIDDELNAAKGYEPYRRILLHAITEERREPECWEAALHRIFKQPPDGDDYNSASQIMDLQQDYGYPCNEDYSQDNINRAVEHLNRTALNVHWARFKETMDLDNSYYRIKDAEKEALVTLVDGMKERYAGNGNFGMWFRLCSAIESSIETAMEARKVEYRNRLEAAREKLGAQPEDKRQGIAEYIEAMIEKGNFKGAEDAIKRIDANEPLAISVGQLGSFWLDSFLKFLERRIGSFNSPASRNGTLESIVSSRLRSADIGSGGMFQDIREDNPLISNWPKRSGDVRNDHIIRVLRELSFDVRRVDIPSRSNNIAVFLVSVNSTPKDLIDYIHPFSQFGTAIRDGQFYVLCLFGIYTPDTLIAALIKTLRPDIGSIVLLDGALDPVQRQQVAEKIKTGEKRQMPFLLIDRVLGAFLAGIRRREDRLPALMQCCMPYTMTQPYNTNGAGLIPEEMFFGRSMHLESILSPTGTNLVYGARQLGKTALLRRAQSRAHYPAKKEYAVYVEVLKKGADETLREVVLQLKTARVLTVSCKSWEELREALMRSFQAGTVSKLLLLIDEADAFIDECSRNDFAPISELQRLKLSTSNAFKYVLAGVHNVSKQAANYYKENSPLAQLGEPLAVRPLTYQDAEELVKRPLNYLGFRIEREQLSLILVNSYFYPGLIHLFCGKLIDTVAERYRDFYSGKPCPPFAVTDDLIAAVLDQAKMNEELRKKLEMTLTCDSRYYMLANCLGCMALLLGQVNDLDDCWTASELHGNTSPFSKEMAAMTVETVDSLLSEMTDLGLLYKDNRNRYGFRMSSYKELFSDEAKIMKYLDQH